MKRQAQYGIAQFLPSFCQFLNTCNMAFLKDLPVLSSLKKNQGKGGVEGGD
ncbi:Hypothetical protein Minf_1487 [Methylacidiphilum infernorum V4]|uniref:Uncharacterized protein n=1 Tax=Methylacidiphilum infernorum (isolate V4) TaxID=481448 RepID=B3DW38_METI4|nr:Hypothetical protein Minf_1487 [Methylacidiphilum infernorum V4]